MNRTIKCDAILFICIMTLTALYGCSTSAELEYVRHVNGTGESEYFGAWVNVFKNVLFWPYAIVFLLLGMSHDGLNRLCHIALTVALFISFNWDFAPLRAFIFAYYIFMPLLHVPRFSNQTILSGVLIVCTITMLYLGFKDWQYKGLLLWAFDMVAWGLCAYGGCILLLMQQYGRCPHCGRYALSWRSQTTRYEQAIEHYRYLNPDGSDSNVMLDSDSAKQGNQLCAHCSRYDHD